MPGHVCKAGNRTLCIIIIIWSLNWPVALSRVRQWSLQKTQLNWTKDRQLSLSSTTRDYRSCHGL